MNQGQRIEELEKACAQAIEAFDFTSKYVGEKMLPAIPGWSWYDATLELNRVLQRGK